MEIGAPDAGDVDKNAKFGVESLLLRAGANSDGEFQLEEAVSLLSRGHGAGPEQEGHEVMDAFTAAHNDASKDVTIGARQLAVEVVWRRRRVPLPLIEGVGRRRAEGAEGAGLDRLRRLRGQLSGRQGALRQPDVGRSRADKAVCAGCSSRCSRSAAAAQ